MKKYNSGSSCYRLTDRIEGGDSLYERDFFYNYFYNCYFYAGGDLDENSEHCNCCEIL